MKKNTSRAIFLAGHSLAVFTLATNCGFAKSTVATVDKRILESQTYRSLLEPPFWETGNYQSRIWPALYGGYSGQSPLNVNIRRAEQLAAHGHIAEAIAEWTKLINQAKTQKAVNGASALNPNWFISRARLFYSIGLTKDALNDVENSLNAQNINASKKEDNHTDLKAGALLLQMGQYKLAEKTLTQVEISEQSSRPYKLYLLALSEQAQNKKQLAQLHLTDAATLFAANGNLPEAQACLDFINQNRRTDSPKLSFGDLKPPSSHYDELKTLIIELANDPDIFDKTCLQKHLDLKVKYESAGYSVLESALLANDLRSVNLDILPKDGKRLTINLKTSSCSIAKSALKDLLTAPANDPMPTTTGAVNSECYKVAAGRMLIRSFADGFNSIYQVQFISPDAVFDKQKASTPVLVQRTIPKEVKRNIARNGINDLNVKEAEIIAEEWLKEEPESPRALALQAEICHHKKDFSTAVSLLEKAVKYDWQLSDTKGAPRQNELISKLARYQLDNGKYFDAYETLNKATNSPPTADQLTLRARAAIGLNLITPARKDLTDARKIYFDTAEIGKRDEVANLLASLDMQPTKQKNQGEPQLNPQNMSQATKKREAEQTNNRLRELEFEHQQQIEKLAREEQQRALTPLAELLFASVDKESNRARYVVSLADFAQTAAKANQNEIAQKYMDKAIQAFQTYKPTQSYDPCTIVLVEKLSILKGKAFEDGVVRVAKRSELFCRNPLYKNYRDRAFTNLTHDDDGRFAMIETLIEIRKSLCTETDISTASLDKMLGTRYKGKGVYKNLSDYFVSQTVLPVSTDDQIKALFIEADKAATRTENLLDRIKADGPQSGASKINEAIDATTFADFPGEFSKSVQFTQYLSIAKAYQVNAAIPTATKIFERALNTRCELDATRLKLAMGILLGITYACSTPEDCRLTERLYDLIMDKLSDAQVERCAEIAEINLYLGELYYQHSRLSLNKQETQSLESKAKELFDQCIVNDNAVEGQTKDGLELRQAIASRYPALIKLDIPNGPVTYQSDEDGSIMGGCSLNGREVQIIGPSSINLGGTGNRLQVVLDGLTLTQLGLAELKKGDISRAVEVFTSALRASPDAQTFALLAECWFLQGKVKEGLQASSLALELDDSNNHAAAVQRLCQSDLHQDALLNSKTEKLLIAASGNDPTVTDMTRALSLLALGKKDEAANVLTNILEHDPTNYRAKALKAKCSGAQ